MTAGQKLGVIKKSGALIVKGKDSIRFLNGMLTQDIQTNMLPNAGRSFFLTPKGKIISSLFGTKYIFAL
jgi:folate-binding Fe-S cluster repair protein YgfZ